MNSPQPYEVLEQDLARWCGRDHVAVCSTGTAALHLALEALALPPGSEVLVPDFTFIACARAVTLAGLTPVFIDCGDDLNIHPPLIEEACFGHNVSAVMPVHVYGRRCDMEAIGKIADWRGLKVVEDMAEMHGVSPYQYSDVACWSFYRNKIVSGEEGGACAFLSGEQAALARKLRSLGYEGGGIWEHLPRGHNYRMTNTQAELIRVSLQNARFNIAEKCRTMRVYDDVIPSEWGFTAPTLSPWMYTIRIPGLGRGRQLRVVDALKAQGIEARPGFYPMSTQKEYRGYRRLGTCRAIGFSNEVVALPIWRTPTDMIDRNTQEEVEKIVRVIRDNL